MIAILTILGALFLVAGMVSGLFYIFVSIGAASFLAAILVFAVS